MVTYLYGDDTYRSRQHLRELVAKFRAAAGQDVVTLADDGLTAEALRQATGEATLFSARRLVVAEGLLDGKPTAALVEAAKEAVARCRGDEPSRNTLVVYQAGVPDQRLALSKLLAAEPGSRRFDPMPPSEAVRWCQTLVAEGGATLQPAAAATLVAAVGTDGWALANECAKLAAYRHGGTVAEADVRDQVSAHVPATIFELVDALGAQRRDRALGMLEELVANGEPPLYLLAMLSRQVRLLALARTASSPAAFSKAAGVPGFVATKVLRQAQAFDLPRLRKAYRLLEQVDMDLKTSRVPEAAALSQLVAAL
jgi:DNA polymerase-3 subunit delta